MELCLFIYHHIQFPIFNWLTAMYYVSIVINYYQGKIEAIMDTQSSFGMPSILSSIPSGRLRSSAFVERVKGTGWPE